MKAQTEQLMPVPTIETDGWGGYQHFTDPTRLPFNTLTYPSINCFVPSKDKVVPRAGKTLLGESANIVEGGIHFDATSQGRKVVDYSMQKISEENLEFNASANAYNASIQVDGTHVLNFWAEETSNDLVVQVFEVDLQTGVITAIGTKLVIDTGFAGYNSCASLGDGEHFINFWSGSTNDGFVQVFNVNPSTFAVTALDTKTTFESAAAFYMSCVQVDANHFLNFWGTSSPSNKAQIAEVNLGTFAVTMQGSPLTVDASAGAYNSCGQVDSTHYVNFWQSTSSDGKVQVFEVDLGTWAVTALSSPLTFESGSASFNSCSFVDSTHYINFWNSGVGGRAQAFTINLSTFAVTAVDVPLEFAVAATYNSCAAAFDDGEHFINFWRNGAPGDLLCQIFRFTGSSVLALSSSLTYDQRSNTIFNSCVPMGVNSNGFVIFINFWGGTKVDTTSNDAVALFGFQQAIYDLTFSHTCHGDNRMLWVTIVADDIVSGDQVESVTYNGIPMTLSQKTDAYGTTQEIYMYYLIAPDIGSHDVNIQLETEGSLSISLTGYASSYTDVLQEAPDIGSEDSSISTTIFSIFTTTTEPASMVVGFFVASNPITVSNSNIRNFSFARYAFVDSGTIDVPEEYEMSVTMGGFASDVSGMTAIMSPFSATDQIANWPIIGHKKRYTNDGGYMMEARVVRTDSDSLKDRIDVLLPNPANDDELEWYQITETVNPLPVGTNDRYYMDQYFDTNLDASKSRKNSRLVWVNGNKTIYSWSGGVAPIVAVVPDVSISTTDGVSWESLGFVQPVRGGSNKIVVRGVAYTVTSGWATDTLLLADTGDIAVDDVATAHISALEGSIDVVPTDPDLGNIDFCRQNKNYMFYGSWNTRQLLMSNAFNKPSVTQIVNSQAGLNDLIIDVTNDFVKLGILSLRVTIQTAGTPDQYRYSYTLSNGDSGNGNTINITGTGQAIGDTGVVIRFLETTGHEVGDFWEITARQAVGVLDDTNDNPPAWANFFYEIPRVPGEGYIFTLGANFWTMERQEEDMYVGDQYGNWAFINTQIAADLMSETIEFQPLKQISASKPIYPYMVSNMENYIVFVTENKKLDFIGRQQFLELPQADYLSKPVELDFQLASFTNGSLEYLNKMLFITSPKESVMLVYDNRAENKYWQPPQVINENGILSIVDDTLITHSNLRDQTFNLFTGKSDNGAAFTVRARTASTAWFKNGRPARWDSKFSNNSFIEGYVEGNPELIMTIYTGVNDPNGQSHIIKPVITNNPPDNASIGQDVLAGHPLGNDPQYEGTYFNEIHEKFKPVLEYYFIAMQIACTSKNHTYSILSLGMNMAFAPTGNNTLVGDREID